MPFTDPRLPGKEYKTTRGLQTGLRALEKRLRGTPEYFEAFPEQEVTTDAMCAICGSIKRGDCLTCQPGETPSPQAYAGPYFLRNLRHVPVRLHFGGKDGRTINLRPRGQRGDCSPPLQPGDEYDTQMTDVGVLFEILGAGQVAQVIHGQTTNQQAVHPALHHLRTETGEKYPGEVKIEEEFNQQGFTVGTVVDQGPNKSNQQRSVVQRTPRIDLAVAPERAALPGTQDRPIAHVSESVAPEDQAAYVAEQGGVQELMRRDAVAREKGAEGPQAGLGGLQFGGITAPNRDTLVTTRFDDGQIDPSHRVPAAPVSGSEVW